MKKFLGSVVPFLLFHLVCCGGLIIFLASSGYLLLVSQEGNRKTYLIPLLVLGGIFFLINNRMNKHCEAKGHKSIGDQILLISFYVMYSVIFGIAFMVYVFIPWWIPGYRGGFLLP